MTAAITRWQGRACVATASVALALGLLSTAAHAQVARSQSFDVTQDPDANTTTATCTLGADGVDPKSTYSGHVYISFSNPAENNTKLVDTYFAVGPTAKTFVEQGTGGAYLVEVKLRRKGVLMVAEAVRTGPLWIQTNNSFTCTAEIYYGMSKTDVVNQMVAVHQVTGPPQ